jgi:type IV fimbrial biogenesis protein FimT
MLSGHPSSLHSRGFTLVEMMVSISIIVILLGIAIPNFRTFVLNAQIRSTAEGLLAGLNLARTEAIRRNTDVTFWMVNGITSTCERVSTGTSWVVSVNDPEDSCHSVASTTSSPRIVQARAATEVGGNIKVTATGGTCLTFNGFGGTEASCPGNIARFTEIDIEPPTGTAARALQIALSAGGSVRLCDPDTALDTSDPARCPTNPQ